MDLKSIQQHLKHSIKNPRNGKHPYAVPSWWSDGSGGGRKPSAVPVNPAEFYSSAVARIAAEPAVPIRRETGGTWTRHAVIYNVFVRTTCAFDHNGSGALDLPVNPDGWRETGTFLKAVAMLPYIRSLGVNTIHLLPITAIGSDGNKGTLGSPYAIRNPYHLDENLAEPNAGLGVEKEFRLFVDAAHHLGMRVVVEFVFRTSSKDGDWVKEHPEWFYWIRADVKDRPPRSQNETEYGNPIFTPEELTAILGSVEEGNLDHLPPPHKAYRDMFTPPPRKSTITLEHGRYIGVTKSGERVRIPGAFADWPPQDTQPPWGDVTYLKMYDHPDFNYIAYNTIRMYDHRLATPANVNRPLWDAIAGIIPHYQKEFGIDGVMIDMGHALPMDLKREMISRAREIDPDFAFWDENFSITKKSVDEGYNAVIGYQWSDQHHPDKFRSMLRRFTHEGFALPFFATAESHNTPRAAARKGGLTYSTYAWALSNLIPAVPFIHSGFELGETYPINTGLDFKPEELKHFPSEQLPLFSEYAYDWLRSKNLIGFIRNVAEVRNRHRETIENTDPASFRWIEVPDQHVIAFLRVGARHARSGDPGHAMDLLAIANQDMTTPVTAHVPILTQQLTLKDLFGGGTVPVKDGMVTVMLAPGQVVAVEL